MTNNLTYQVDLKVVDKDIIGVVTANIDDLQKITRKATKEFFRDSYKVLFGG